MTPLAAALLVAVTAACPPARVPTESSLRIGPAVHCDLDGDAVADRIEIRASGDDFEVRIGGARLLGHGMNLDSTFAIVDIDSMDGRREIAITEQGPSDDYATHFFTLDGDTVLAMGMLPGSSEMTLDGSGIVRTEARGQILHTWFHPAYWRLDASHRLVAIELPLYAMNTPVRVLRPLTLRRSPTDPRPGVRLARGERATILASDDERWCLVRSASGATGWFEVDSSRIEGREAHEYFDGLSGAD